MIVSGFTKKTLEGFPSFKGGMHRPFPIKVCMEPESQPFSNGSLVIFNHFPSKGLVHHPTDFQPL